MNRRVETSLHKLHSEIMETLNVNSDIALKMMCEAINKRIDEECESKVGIEIDVGGTLFTIVSYIRQEKRIFLEAEHYYKDN